MNLAGAYARSGFLKSVPNIQSLYTRVIWMYADVMLMDYIEQMCDTFQDAICVTDKEGFIVLVNSRYTELTGLAKDEVIGKRVHEMTANGIFDHVLNPSIVRSGEKTASIQQVYNGRILHLDGNPIKDANGNVAYVITTIRDSTALAELREVINAQKELLETFQHLKNESTAIQSIQFPRIVQSQPMRRLYGEAAAIADTDATVLLLGETGTGKDVMARHIHRLSARSTGPFIKVDCGSIPENLVETELFGYAPGSFSGASKNGKAGLVEAANGGTLFLDEVGELPLAMQSRLLRVLQDREVLRVGATIPKKVDARVLAATNKDLEKEMERGAFRADLYYRLKVAVLTLPPLRERKADILPLAQGFLKFYERKFRKSAKFSEEAEQLLENHDWPGNVRELENLVQGALVTAKQGIIDASSLSGINPPASPKSEPQKAFAPAIEGRTFKDIMKDLEIDVLKAGLARYGTMLELAKHFNMDRSTIFRKLKPRTRTPKK